MEAISDLLDRRARDDSAKPFCVFDGSVVSFGELQQRVNSLATGFAALGIRSGDRVAVMLANHPDHPMVFLAAVAATAFANPGLTWAGRYFQLGMEAQVPMNNASGKNVGVRGLIHVFIDDIWPNIFTWTPWGVIGPTPTPK